MARFKKAFGILMVLAMITGLGLVACSSEGEKETLSKEDLKAQGKADGVESLCQKFGLPKDCDLCREYGFYGDGACDADLMADGGIQACSVLYQSGYPHTARLQ